jgi:hypothetical protein
LDARRPTPSDIAALVESLRARGIRRIYPFLGPMDRDGWPGWRSKKGLVRYVPERAGAFLAEIKRIAPEIRVIPWTGGNLGSDVRLKDETPRRAFAEHARRLVALGADGVQLNVEPLPSWAPGFQELLREVKAAIGDRTLSIAAYPPPTPLHPFPEVHWELPLQGCAPAARPSISAASPSTRRSRPTHASGPSTTGSGAAKSPLHRRRPTPATPPNRQRPGRHLA